MNESIQDSYALSKPEHLSFTDADGFVVDGWVMRPAGYVPGSAYPAILNIHGGPKGAFGDIFFHEMQYWAGQGYFVLYCNPRGSSGKGNAFAELRGAYGTYDYDDLMRFTDLCLERYPDIDQARLGVTGGSYGGFMTNWIIGHTSRFKAAASQRSISNWISFAGTSDIGYLFAEDQIAASVEDAPEKLWWHSPLRCARRAVTPTLFIHSDEDYRCWIAEGYQMFTALRKRGVDTRMCVFHGENHELSRSGKPQHRLRRLSEITAWFDQRLKPR
jgi:acylaminoacyl-peptidase